MADTQSVLVVIDMQNDFITGSLGTPEAQAILDGVVEKVEDFPGRVLYTFDTHGDDYLETQEGRTLPVEHCLRGTDGRSPASSRTPSRAKAPAPTRSPRSGRSSSRATLPPSTASTPSPPSSSSACAPTSAW